MVEIRRNGGPTQGAAPSPGGATGKIDTAETTPRPPLPAHAGSGAHARPSDAVAPDGDLGELGGSDAEAYAALKARRAERRRKRLVRRCVAGGILLLVALGGFLVLGSLGKRSENPDGAVTDLAIRGTFTTVVEAKGTLQPLSSTVITPEVDGQVESIAVTAGQTVAVGDVVMTIRNPELDRAVSEAERGLHRAEADLAAARRALAGTDENGGEGAAAPRTDLSSAQDAVESAKATYDDAVARAALRTVRAPSAGLVVALNAQVGTDLGGDAAGAQGSGPLMQIADLSKMKVVVQVDEKDIASVAIDQSATITCPAFPDLTLTGRVAAIASIASSDGTVAPPGDMARPTFAVDILIDSPDPRLKPGMTAEISLTTRKIDDVVMVPLAALLDGEEGRRYVNVQSDGESASIERRDVEVIAQNDNFAVVGKPEGAAPEENPDMPVSPIGDGDVLVIAGGAGPGSEAMGG